MNDELTLREKVLQAMIDEIDSDVLGVYGFEDAIKAICDALEDAGDPAHMRVAAELRGLGDA